MWKLTQILCNDRNSFLKKFDGNSEREFSLSSGPELPDDVLCMIFAFLEVKDLFLGICLCCKKWNSIVSCGRVYLLEPWYSKPKDNSKLNFEGKNYLEKK